MPVPARKKSNASGRRRRSHDSMKPIQASVCMSCNAPRLPHRACPSCKKY